MTDGDIRMFILPNMLHIFITLYTEQCNVLFINDSVYKLLTNPKMFAIQHTFPQIEVGILSAHISLTII